MRDEIAVVKTTAVALVLLPKLGGVGECCVLLVVMVMVMVR